MMRAPAIPAYIDGSFEAMLRSRRLPRLCHIRIKIGLPLSVDTLMAKGDAQPQTIANQLHEAVSELGRSIGINQ